MPIFVDGGLKPVDGITPPEHALINHDGLPGVPVGGKVVSTQFATYGGATGVTNVIPYDDSVPQQGGAEGAEIISLAITPENASNVLCIRYHGNCSVSSTAILGLSALFQDAIPGAIYAMQASASDEEQLFSWEFWVSAASVAARTYRIRIGPSSAGTLFPNTRFSGVAIFGGVNFHVMSIIEYAP